MFPSRGGFLDPLRASIAYEVAAIIFAGKIKVCAENYAMPGYVVLNTTQFNARSSELKSSLIVDQMNLIAWIGTEAAIQAIGV